MSRIWSACAGGASITVEPSVTPTITAVATTPPQRPHARIRTRPSRVGAAFCSVDALVCDALAHRRRPRGAFECEVTDGVHPGAGCESVTGQGVQALDAHR